MRGLAIVLSLLVVVSCEDKEPAASTDTLTALDTAAEDSGTPDGRASDDTAGNSSPVTSEIVISGQVVHQGTSNRLKTLSRACI